MAKDEKEKVGLDQVNFLPLGSGEIEQPEKKEEKKEEVKVDTETDEEEIQEQEKETSSGQEDDEDLEVETEDGDPPANTEDEDEEEPEIIDEEEDEGDDPDEEEEEPSIFQSAIEGADLDLSDEAFKGINFDDPTTDDLSKFVDVVSDKISQRKLDSVFEQYPEAKGFLEYAQKGGDPRQYIETMYPQVDYTQVDFDEQVAENEAAQEQLIRTYLAADGTEEEEIDELVEDYRAGGLLAKQAKRSLNKLSSLQKDQQEQLIAQQEKAAEERQKAAKAQREEIETLIKKSESVKGLTLPDTDKEDLESYLFEPIDDKGRSQAFIDGQSMTNEERVAIAYLKMKGFDFESLIGNEAETRNAKKLKTSIKKSKEDKMTKKQDKQKRTSGQVQDIKPIF